MGQRPLPSAPRTMEDASAVDLDWFWRGWFYTTDHVDVTVSNVRWYKVVETQEALEGRTQEGKLEAANVDENGNYTDFTNGYEPLTVTKTDPALYDEFRSKFPDEKVQSKLMGKNLYELTLLNTGGLVSPVIIEWTYTDGTTEIEKLPAEIWRTYEIAISKVFIKEKEVENITIDPFEETADTNTGDNHFPKRDVASRFEQFKEKEGKN